MAHIDGTSDASCFQPDRSMLRTTCFYNAVLVCIAQYLSTLHSTSVYYIVLIHPTQY